MNADGSLDTTFTNGANTCVFSGGAGGRQDSGRGLFTNLAGQTRNYLGRLNADGSLDTTFTNGANDTVYSLAVQADGKILVGGMFHERWPDQTRNYLGRLNADGSLDTTFTNGANNVCVLSGGAGGRQDSGRGLLHESGRPGAELSGSPVNGQCGDTKLARDNELGHVGTQRRGAGGVANDIRAVEQRSRLDRAWAPARG